MGAHGTKEELYRSNSKKYPSKLQSVRSDKKYKVAVNPERFGSFGARGNINTVSAMEGELKELKSVLKSLVVSSPTQVTLFSLLRDYRDMMGAPLPLAKYGYRSAVDFLRERCDDCFLFQGPSTNPTLTLIVPDTLKHIDNFVQKQRVTPSAKFKGKRRSVPESTVRPPENNLITESFDKRKLFNRTTRNQTNSNGLKTKSDEPASKLNNNHYNISASEIKWNGHIEAIQNKHSIGGGSTERLAQRLHNSVCLDEATNESNSLRDDDSVRQASSSTSDGSTRARRLVELKLELQSLIAQHPDGVWSADLPTLYRERYDRELNYQRFGFTSLMSLLCMMDDVLRSSRSTVTGDWLLEDAHAPPRDLSLPAAAQTRPRTSRPPARGLSVDCDDALPGIDFDPDVFPADCIHPMESIPGVGTADVAPGTMLEVTVGEVYSPSHFWMQRLGDNYNIAMENMMDDMNDYYIRGAGQARRLATAACSVGSYCACLYKRDWHRALIVKVLDSDTVKVRHVDYGTVECVALDALKPLLRCWTVLPAQATRARLANVRPTAAGRRWPRSAAARFLALVSNNYLVASVVAVDHEEEILEVLLFNTTTSEDVCISAELIRGGYADAREGSALKTDDCYLLPTFVALEDADTLNYAEIHRCLSEGIELEFVEEYRRHVPPCAPPTTAATAPIFEPESEPESVTENATAVDVASVELMNRVPLQMAPAASALLSSSPPTPCAISPQYSLTQATPTYVASYQSGPAPQAYYLTGPVRYLPYAPPPPPCATWVPREAWAPSEARQHVSLSTSDCETYQILSRVNPTAAHQFMMIAIERAQSVASANKPLDPNAAEFCSVSAHSPQSPHPYAGVLPPPGF